jgi:hypothetical protein
VLDSALFLNLNSAAAAVSEEMRCSGAVNELGILSLPAEYGILYCTARIVLFNRSRIFAIFKSTPLLISSSLEGLEKKMTRAFGALALLIHNNKQ